MEPQDLDPREFLEAIRQDRQRLVWMPLDALDQGGEGGLGLRMVAEDRSLEFLHHHWVLPDSANASLGKGLRGRIAKAFARLTFRVLEPYLQEERELLANMVQVQDVLAKRVDEIVGDVHRRRVHEAQNLAELAAWLHGGPLGETDAPARN